jgi:hypothetical protein
VKKAFPGNCNGSKIKDLMHFRPLILLTHLYGMGGKAYLNPKAMAQLTIHNDQEPAKRELAPSKSGEWSVSKAIKARRIFLCTDEEIEEALKYAMLLTGIRAQNMPQKEEKVVFINWIRNNYMTHTCEEIKLAFDMAMAGKLDIEDAKCYENFSIEYFGRIFHAYRVWASEQISSMKTTKVPETFKSLEASGADWSKEWESLQRTYENCQDFTSPLYEFVIWSSIYDWLKREGKIKGSWEAMEQAREMEIRYYEGRKIMNKANPEDRANLERLKCVDWKEDKVAISLLLTRSKRIAVQQLLTKIKSENES